MNTEDFEGYSNQLGVNRVWRAQLGVSQTKLPSDTASSSTGLVRRS